MKDTVLNKVYDLVDEIKLRKEYIRLLELKKIMENDPLIINLINDFNKCKVKFEEVSKYGKHHPDLKKVQLELASIKTKVFTNEIIVEYKKLEKEIQKILDDVSRKIAQSVSPKIKYPNEMGLINKH
ncbi:MAG: hypothetical protein KQ78_01670 [Candidatus Izimaplasma bacterium HR2]|nr:MAG: hypothetical protein KQ78_01670 [Candidatus Izimaplasma bacterium HR2]